MIEPRPVAIGFERFGNPLDFAIDAGIEPDWVRPHLAFGQMCVWCGGFPLGNLENRFCALYGAYQSFQMLNGCTDSLWAPELAGLDDVAAWNFFDERLYGYHGDFEIRDDRSIERIRADWARWSHHNFLTNWGEMFDGFKSFIFCPPGGQLRILSRRLVGAGPGEAKVLPGVVFWEVPKSADGHRAKLTRDLAILCEETRDKPNDPR